MFQDRVLAGDAPAASLSFEPKRGALERLPKWAIIVPLAGQWLYLSLRFGGLTVPSAANPALTAGGLVGEGKREYFDTMGMLARAATAHRRVGRRRNFAFLDPSSPSGAEPGATMPVLCT